MLLTISRIDHIDLESLQVVVEIPDCHITPLALGVVLRQGARERSRAPMRDAVQTADPGSVLLELCSIAQGSVLHAAIGVMHQPRFSACDAAAPYAELPAPEPLPSFAAMRSDNLLCVRRRKFLLTTDSRHGLPIYPNLVEGLVVTRIDQLWVADITYIRLQVEFVYLAVLLDAFSRRCLGWVRPRTRL
jgi:hypothetical protein